MPNIDFICPNCNAKGKITLMGESQGTFEKKCKECKATVNLDVKYNNSYLSYINYFNYIYNYKVNSTYIKLVFY